MLADLPYVVAPGGIFPPLFISLLDDELAESPIEVAQFSIRTEMPRIQIFRGQQLFRILDDDSEF